MLRYFGLIIAFLLFSCKKKEGIGGKEHKLTSKDLFESYCEPTVNADFKIFVNHESLSAEELSNYKMVIDYDGLKVYKGSYEPEIRVLRLCKEHFVNEFAVITIYLIKGDKYYSFHRKTSFSIDDKEIYIKLLSEEHAFGSQYSEKTDDEWFYAW